MILTSFFVRWAFSKASWIKMLWEDWAWGMAIVLPFKSDKFLMSFLAIMTLPSLWPKATALRSMPLLFAFIASSTSTDAPSILPAFKASIKSAQLLNFVSLI